MKHNFIVITIMIGLLTACGSSNSDTADSASVDSLTPIRSDTTSETLPNTILMFGMTKDKSYCDDKQFLASDCGGGMFYFTEKGGVIREDWCCGSDTSSFTIGTYAISNGQVVCTFDQDYSFFNGYNDDEEELPYDPNAGKLVKLSAAQTIQLDALDCGKYKYGFHSSEGSSSYVLFEADTAQSGPFVRLCKRITAFEGM